MRSTGTGRLADKATGASASKSATLIRRDPGRWGCTYIGAPGATVAQIESGLSGVETTTGRKATSRKAYYGLSDGLGNVKYFPTALSQDPYLQAGKDRKDRMVLCYRPYCDASGQGSAADGAALKTSLLSLKAAGLDVVADLHQEAQDHLAAAAYKANVAYYRPYVAAAGVPLAYNAAGHTGAAAWAAWDPGGSLIDLYLLDLYAKSWVDGNDPAPFIALAHAAGRPWGLGEMGVSVGSEIPPTVAQVQQFFARIASLVRADQDAGLPVDSCSYYYQPSKNANNDPSPYVAQIQVLADTLTLAA